jgi:hypothetical protein
MLNAVLFYHHLAGVAMVRIARSEHQKVQHPAVSAASLLLGINDASIKGWSISAEEVSCSQQLGKFTQSSESCQSFCHLSTHRVACGGQAVYG